MPPLALVLLAAATACGGDGSDVPLDPDAAAAGVDAAPPPPAPALTLLDYALAVDVTPDGRTAVFEAITASAASIVFFDTVAGTGEIVALVGSPDRDLATGVSATRRVSALHGDPVQAGLWQAQGDWRDLGSPFAAGCDQDVASAFDVSADGHVAVGLAWNGCSPEAYRWSDAGGAGAFTRLAVLGSAPQGASGGPANRATVVSDDGTVAAGFAQTSLADRRPAAWTADGQGFLLDPSDSDLPGEVLSISADGKVLAGSLGSDGFVWTKGTGIVIMQRFELALPTDPVFPNAMTADGTWVFGAVGDAFFGVPTAFVWSAPDGMRALADVAAAHGVPVPQGVVLNNVLGASADGTVLIGTALDDAGAPRTFVLRLPAGTFAR